MTAAKAFVVYQKPLIQVFCTSTPLPTLHITSIPCMISVSQAADSEAKDSVKAEGVDINSTLEPKREK